MNLGICTIAYNGYGKFAKQWCQYIADLKTQPVAATIILGQNHGLTNKKACLELVPYLKFVYAEDARPKMGIMRNLAVQHTNAEWIMYLSIDDGILPDAIDIMSEFEHTADYISISWLTTTPWIPDSENVHHLATTPHDMAVKNNGHGFIIGHSPFRRSFWQTNKYRPHDYPNAPFVADLMEAGARFAKTVEPCTIYLRRMDSHSRLLGRRMQAFDYREKKRALVWKADMETRIRKYYDRRS